MPTNPKYLQEFRCFRNLPEAQLKLLAQITDAVCYPPDYVLFEEGQPGKRLFFLVKGDMDILHNIGRDGEVLVDTVSGEKVVGCSSLIQPYTYTATERGLTEVEVLEVDALALRQLMEKDCHLGMLIQQHIMRVLMKRILELRLAAA
jgi:CRP/FNR family transcriptional regulator, cyclic AMP receptor protein